MPLAGEFDETRKARVRRDPEFREALLNEAIAALLRGELEVGKALAAQASATDAELLQRIEDQADAAVLRERLEDGNVSECVSHDKVVADLSG